MQVLVAMVAGAVLGAGGLWFFQKWTGKGVPERRA